MNAIKQRSRTKVIGHHQYLLNTVLVMSGSYFLLMIKLLFEFKPFYLSKLTTENKINAPDNIETIGTTSSAISFDKSGVGST